MTHTRYAFVKAVWHAYIVGKALEGFLELVPPEDVDVSMFPAPSNSLSWREISQLLGNMLL